MRLAVPFCASSPRLQVVSHWWHAQERNVEYDLRSKIPGPIGSIGPASETWRQVKVSSNQRYSAGPCKPYSWRGFMSIHPEASTCFVLEKLPIIRLDPFSKVASLVQRSFIHREGFQCPICKWNQKRCLVMIQEFWKNQTCYLLDLQIFDKLTSWIYTFRLSLAMAPILSVPIHQPWIPIAQVLFHYKRMSPVLSHASQW